MEEGPQALERITHRVMLRRQVVLAPSCSRRRIGWLCPKKTPGSSMAKSVSEIRFEARPMKAGSNWMVVITFPDRTEMHVDDFPEEADAKSWITNDSREWLGKLGYG